MNLVLEGNCCAQECFSFTGKWKVWSRQIHGFRDQIRRLVFPLVASTFHHWRRHCLTKTLKWKEKEKKKVECCWRQIRRSWKMRGGTNTMVLFIMGCLVTSYKLKEEANVSSNGSMWWRCMETPYALWPR